MSKKRTKAQKIKELRRLIPILPEAQQKEAILYLRRIGELDAATEDNSSELIFSAKSVPNDQNQLRIPMYLETFDGGYYQNSIITDAGEGLPARANPTVIVDISNTRLPVLDQTIASYSTDSTFGHYIIKGMTFSTRQTPWSKMRVVGIETDVRYTPTSPVLPDSANNGDNVALGIGLGVAPRILLKNYRVSGSANLLLQEGYIDGTFYSVKRQMFGGLRAYPVLESPKTLKIDIALSGEHYHGSAIGGRTITFSNGINVPTSTNYSVTVAAIVEVIDDVQYGRTTPAPYARGESLLRTPPANGQSFISGE